MFDRSNENGATLLLMTVFGILVFASLLSTRQCEARMSQKRDAGSRRFEAHPNRQAGVLAKKFKTSRKMWRRDAQIKSICCSYCAVYSCQAIPKVLKGVRRSCLFCQQKYCLVGIWTTSGSC
ncbi:uncharacterized protein LOC143466019 [Clavelina lepadiformis]|uniref:uncharacterized protein LOC143466019 n=1 Tax=Clavelina lepadiformis TaxID=159417 RepID=UPI0040426F61